MGKLFDKAQRAEAALDFEEAERLFKLAARMDPKNLATLHNLGGVLSSLSRLPEAEKAYRRALAIDPGSARTHYALSQVIMMQGRYRDALPHFRRRHEVAKYNTNKPSFFECPEWNGEDLGGRSLLIWPEQGFGDELQYARFAPILAERGATVRLVCRPQVSRLFSRSLPGVEVYEGSGRVEIPDCDFYVMGPDLVGLMDYTLETVPGAPYLKAAGKLSSSARIGLVTAGSAAHGNNGYRSLDQADGLKLAAALGATVGLDHAATGGKDFADTADIIEGLDVVVTVDTAIAHLAGGMGKTVWLLLTRIDTDWRWGRGQARSTWYPSAELFFSDAKGRWTETIARLGERAAALETTP